MRAAGVAVIGERHAAGPQRGGHVAGPQVGGVLGGGADHEGRRTELRGVVGAGVARRGGEVEGGAAESLDVVRRVVVEPRRVPGGAPRVVDVAAAAGHHRRHGGAAERRGDLGEPGQGRGGRVVVTAGRGEGEGRAAGHGHADHAAGAVEPPGAGERGGQLGVEEGVPAVDAEDGVGSLPVGVEAEPAALGAGDEDVLVGEEVLVVGVVGPADVVLAAADAVEQEQQRRRRGPCGQEDERRHRLVHGRRPHVGEDLAALHGLDAQDLRAGAVGRRRGRGSRCGGEAQGGGGVDPSGGLGGRRGDGPGDDRGQGDRRAGQSCHRREGDGGRGTGPTSG